MNVSIFKNFNKVVDQQHISAILEQIKTGKYRSQVESLRELLKAGKNEAYNEQKKSLLAFTPSATFEGGRKMEFLEEYSGLIILDIDKLSPDQLITIKQIASSTAFTFSVFSSPSGNGLKILVRIMSPKENHTLVFNQVKNFYESLLNVSIDPSGKDITRLCFFSWDPDLYLNSNAEIFQTTAKQVEEQIESVITQIESTHTDITDNYNDWISICFALIDALGSNAREPFHRISRFYSAYDQNKCDIQFDKCLHSNNNGITIKSFFYYAKNHGISLSGGKVSEPVEVTKHKVSEQPSVIEPLAVTELVEVTTSPQIVPTEITDPPTEDPKEKPSSNLFDIIERFLLRFYALRYNVVTSKLEIKLSEKSDYEPMTDYIENSIYRQLHKSNICVSMAKLRSILQSDFCTPYDPFQEYFENLPIWDGTTDHIRQLASTVRTNDDELWLVCFKKWIVAMVASLLNAKVVNHTAIIFSGAQGIGKTTWMEKLCPPELHNYLFSGTINPNNKDTLIHISECMLINMDELENMNRTEIGTLKEIITKSAIRIRRSYGHNNESLIRRASFMGSVNTSQFLNDSTGSRRFLCFEVFEIEYNHSVDICLVYAQALALYKQGFRFYFEKTEVGAISENNEKYQIRTTEEELLLAWFQPVALSDASCFLSASQIIAKLAEKARINISTGSLISLGKALKKHNFSKTKKGGVYVWAVKELTYDEVASNSMDKPDDLPF